ncbi:amino acid ABC transporter substrate-binding protein [Oceanimonas sp. MB9]|uniref:amino acid ABC transporter substrate-binding protein n=1 Tax=Oceanimonas sp. MB9 TaxID=2588453 RepID=UPI0013F62E0B|nr:amino acid ABC transporter substrate-binding protein [Oceanimonas sp. MB9]NHI01522.1 putative amino-acid ABC transporter-binding protein YhdW [Oceanimonas sp. MB9]
MPAQRRGNPLLALLLLAFMLTGLSARAETLPQVMNHGDIRCGVFPDDPGRSAIDENGVWRGFYVDFCRATAAALFGDPTRVQFVEVDATSRFSTLEHRRSDVVMYSATWTLGREDHYRVAFPAIYLFDGQGLMVRRSSGITALADLQGKTICVTENTTTHSHLLSLLERDQIHAQVLFSNGDSFFRGHCDAYTADRINLAINRAHRADNPDEYYILPELLSREPISPMVRNDDDRWVRVIRSVVHALILADDKGITQASVEAVRRQSTDTEVQNLLGVSGNVGERLGLPADWAYQAIRSVGNYSEIYQRHFGPGTPVNVAPGLNQPWSRGGLLYAPLFR